MPKFQDFDGFERQSASPGGLPLVVHNELEIKQSQTAIHCWIHIPLLKLF